MTGDSRSQATRIAETLIKFPSLSSARVSVIDLSSLNIRFMYRSSENLGFSLYIWREGCQIESLVTKELAVANPDRKLRVSR